MATSQMSEVIQHLRRAVLLRDGAGLTDGQLLKDYLSRREEAALAALVRRHGPMVWGVCRRVLRNYHDAEDAFQATFLVLVRKAASIASPELLANWLYGVAHHTALKARATTAKRSARERQVTEMPEPAVTEQDLWNDLQPLLDQELSRLPDKYRVAIVLCEFEGKTRKEAARQLGVPEGTLAARLARGRVMLAKRLARHGLAVSGGALAGVLSQGAAFACVPTSVVSSTIKAATLFAAGQAAAGLISVKVTALTEGVLKAMLMSKLKAAVAVVLVLGFMVTGATVLSGRRAAAQSDKPPAAEERVKTPQKQAQEKEAFTAWGKEVGGLQAGLGYHPGQKRAYSHGETVNLVVRVRNVGKEEVKFQYLREFFIETPPAVTDGKGKPVLLPKVDVSGLIHLPVDVNLAPGKEIELTGSQPFYELKFELRPASESGRNTSSTLHGTGKFQLQYERVFGNSGAGQIKLDPTLSKLATGKLELEVNPEPPAATGKPTVAAQKEGADKKELEKFQGKWAPVSVTVDGKAQDEEQIKQRFMVVKGEKATFLFKDMERGTGSMKIDLSKSPAHIDTTYDDGPVKGMTLKAIYKFEGDTLTICYGGLGEDRPTEFASKPGWGAVLVVQKLAK